MGGGGYSSSQNEQLSVASTFGTNFTFGGISRTNGIDPTHLIIGAVAVAAVFFLRRK